MAKCSMVVMTNAKPGQDDEFNDWYTNTHIDQVLEVPGFVSAQRFMAAGEPGEHGPKYRYYTVYQIDADDPAAVIAEMMRRHNPPALVGCDAMDSDSYFGVYEAMGPVVAK